MAGVPQRQRVRPAQPANPSSTTRTATTTGGRDRTVRARVVALLLLHGPPALLGRVAVAQAAGAHDHRRARPGRRHRSSRTSSCGSAASSRRCGCRRRACTTRGCVDCYIPRLEAARLHTEATCICRGAAYPSGIRLTDATSAPTCCSTRRRSAAPARTARSPPTGITVAQELQASCWSDGEVSLRGATVGSSLHMFGTVLRNPTGRYALNAPQMTVEHVASFADAGRAAPRSSSGTTPPPAPPSAAPRDARATAGAPSTSSARAGCVLDDGRFGHAVVIENARLRMERDQELSLRRITDAGAVLHPAAPRARPGRAVRGQRGEADGQGVELAAGPAGCGWRGFTYQHAHPQGGPLQRPRAPAVARGGDAGVLAASRTSSWRRCTATAARTPTRARCCWPSSGGAARRCRWPASCGLRPGLDGRLRLPARAGRAVDGGAVGDRRAALRARTGRPRSRATRRRSWNAALYALDLLLPVITSARTTLGPGGRLQWVAAGLILLGWVLATTVAAGATRLLRRQ